MKRIFLYINILPLLYLSMIESFSYGANLDLTTLPTTNLNFVYNGNSFEGKLILQDSIDIVENVIINQVGKTCAKQIRGYYFNPARGLSIWPLDIDNLHILQGLDNSYNNLNMSGGLFVCEDGSIYGSINQQRNGNDYYLVAGVNYDFLANNYTYSFAQSMQFVNGLSVGYIFDTYGGIASLIGTGLNIVWNGGTIIHSTLGISTGSISFYKDTTGGNNNKTIDIGTYTASFADINASSAGNDKFVINDMLGLAFTVTMQSSALVATNGTIPATNIGYEGTNWTGVGKALTAYPTGTVDIGSNPITFVGRNNNEGVSRYYQDIKLKVVIPAAQSPGNYEGILTFTY